MASQKQGARSQGGKPRPAQSGKAGQSKAARTQAARNAGYVSGNSAAARRAASASTAPVQKRNAAAATKTASNGAGTAVAARPGLFRSMSVTQWVVLGITLYGLGASVYLTIAHFDTQVGLFCSDKGVVNCEAVTTSSWSELFGIFPVAVLGLAFYVFLTAANSPWAWRWQERLPAIRWARLGSLVVGIVFVLYLIYAETQIGKICLWCTSVHVATFLLFCIVVFDAAYNWGRPSTGS